MAIRWWMLACLVGGLLVLGGCGDDGDEGDKPPPAGSGGNTAGNGSANISPDMAIAGACENQEMLEMCTGIDKFTTCTLGTCKLQPCLDGVCKTYLQCVEGAADPCMNNCMRSAECTTCIKDVPNCALTKCIGELDCP